MVFCSGNKDPLSGSAKLVREKRMKKRERRKNGLKTRDPIDVCKKHTIRIGGEETVVITEKVSGEEVPQKEDY